MNELTDLGLLREGDRPDLETMARWSVRWAGGEASDDSLSLVRSHPEYNPNLALADGVQNAPLTGELFALCALGLLGYEAGKDFRDAGEFAKSLGMAVSEEQVDETVFSELTQQLLCARAKSGREYIEELLDRGFGRNRNTQRIASGALPELLVFGGKARPIFPVQEMLYQCVYVEAPMDTDFDGKRDLIKTWIMRPALTEKGLRCPVILEANPYVGGLKINGLRIGTETVGNYDEARFRNATDSRRQTTAPGKDLPKETLSVPLPRRTQRMATEQDIETFEARRCDMNKPPVLRFEEYMAVRGFASVMCALPGALGSEGLGDVGGISERTAVKAVIDWLCGRGKAFTDCENNIEVTADWCSGSIAMTGQSYTATMAVALAFDGADGLKCIVERAGISSWYRYYRKGNIPYGPCLAPGEEADTLQQAVQTRDLSMLPPEVVLNNEQRIRAGADRDSCAYNDFWDARNYVKDTTRVKAGVFVVHGLNDFNVRTDCPTEVWQAAKAAAVPARLLLHQGEHMTPKGLESLDYDDMMNLWYTAFLVTGDTEPLKQIPPVLVQDNLNQQAWHREQDWPPEAAERKRLWFSDEGVLGAKKGTRTVSFTGNLQAAGFERKLCGELDTEKWHAHIAGSPEEIHAGRLAYVSAPLKERVRICGEPGVVLRLSAEDPNSIVSAMLIDYGEADYTFYGHMELKDGKLAFSKAHEVIKEKSIPQGGGLAPADRIQFSTQRKPYKIITRGSTGIGEPGRGNKSHDCRLTLYPTDYTVEAGHRLGLVVLSADVVHTFWPETTGSISIFLQESFLELPVTAVDLVDIKERKEST